MPDNAGQSPTDGLRLTYAAIASRLGISGEAARQLVRRRGWQRIIPNKPGAPATIVVPEDELAAEQWRQDRPDRATFPDEGDTSPNNVRATHPDSPHLEAEISRLTASLAAADERAAKAEQRAEAADADRRQAAMRADIADSDRRQADADRRTAEARAHEAEQGRERAVALADELRDRVEVAQQRARAAEAAAEAAQIAQAEAEADAAELRQADARGRAGVGWRGSGRRGGGNSKCRPLTRILRRATWRPRAVLRGWARWLRQLVRQMIRRATDAA